MPQLVLSPFLSLISLHSCHNTSSLTYCICACVYLSSKPPRGLYIQTEPQLVDSRSFANRGPVRHALELTAGIIMSQMLAARMVQRFAEVLHVKVRVVLHCLVRSGHVYMKKSLPLRKEGETAATGADIRDAAPSRRVGVTFSQYVYIYIYTHTAHMDVCVYIYIYMHKYKYINI